MTTSLLPTTRPPDVRAPGRAWRTRRRQQHRLLVAGVLTVGLAAGGTALVVVPRMGLTLAQWRFLAHSGAGILVLHALTGGVDGLLSDGTSRVREWMRISRALSLSVGSWAAVLLGTWGTYPGYRATPPAGDGGGLAGYPQAWLEERPGLSGWHEWGMEWKEWVGWLAPFLLTAVAVIALTCWRHLVAADAQLRRLLMVLLAVGTGAVVIAASIGVALNIVHPNDYLR